MTSVNRDMATILLVNPQARRGHQTFEQYRDALKTSVNLVDAALTTSPEDMATRIRDGLQTGVGRFVIGGGDGTLSQAADLLAGTAGVLGVLPLGTGNTFAHGLGLPDRPRDLVQLLAEGPVSRYDVGLAKKGPHQKVFLNSLTMGFSEQLVELLSRQNKARLGYLAWIIKFRRALRKTPPLHVHLTWPGNGEDHYPTRQLVVVNGRTIAAGITATPESSGQDGLLEVFRLGDPALWSIIRLGTKLLAGRLLSDQEAHYVALTEVSITTDPVLPVNIDGEIWLSPPITCEVLAGALHVISPSTDGNRPGRWPLTSQTLGQPRPFPTRIRPYSSRSS